MSGHKQKESQSEPGATAMTGVSLNSKKESVIEKKSKLLTPVKSKQHVRSSEDDVPPNKIEEKLEVDLSLELFTPQKEATVKGNSIRADLIGEVLPLDLDGTPTPVNKSSSAAAVAHSVTTIHPRVDKIYKIVRKMTGALGGNGYNGAIYGELTMHSMQKIVDVLIQKCSLTHNSRFIDVGSGLGKPNFHVAQYPAVQLSIGVELEEIRWQLSIHNLLKLAEVLVSSNRSNTSAASRGDAQPPLFGGVNFILSDIDKAHSLDPFTHIYMYDLGFPPPLQQSIAKKFNNSVHSNWLISYRQPRRVIHEYGYNVKFVDQISTHMHGSGENHTAYFYQRLYDRPQSPVSLPHQCRLLLPPREEGFTPYADIDASEESSSSGLTDYPYLQIRFAELKESESSSSSSSGSSGSSAAVAEGRSVACDRIFLNAAKLALGPPTLLKDNSKGIVLAHLEGGRSQRVRTPRNFST